MQRPVCSCYCLALAVGVLLACNLYSDEKPAKQRAGDFADKAAKALKKFQKPEVLAFRVDGSDEGEKQVRGKHGDGFMRGWPILEEKNISASDIREKVEKVLSAAETYGDAGASCFWPGMAFTWRQEKTTLDVVICLKCRWAYLFETEKPQQLMLSKKGVDELDSLYRQLFKAPPVEGTRPPSGRP